jgi:hypothetical protein
MHRKALIAVALLGALLLPATADAVPLASPGAATAVREHQGILVFSQFDQATSQYRLAIRRPGAAAPELLPVAPADRTFDADIGLGAAGPQLVYTRCDETCNLFTYNLGGGPQGERAIRNANDPEHNDIAPTIWRGRIAWARIYGEQIDRQVIVYTKSLTAPRSRPSTRLPGVPVRRCGDFGPTTCGPTSGRTVESLELWGDNLAQTVTYGCRNCSGISQKELRLVRVSTRQASQVAFQVSGLSGQSLIGPSFQNGFLSWYRACLGDPAACEGGRAQPWRFNLRLRRYARGTGGPIAVHGFADTLAYHYRVQNCSPETSDPAFNARCALEQVPAPDYVSASKPSR